VIKDNRLIFNFLQNTSKVSACGQAIECNQVFNLDYFETKITALHLTAYFGLDTLTSKILEREGDVDYQDYEGRTPLLLLPEMGTRQL
jgi:ankyrin repeat protein